MYRRRLRSERVPARCGALSRQIYGRRLTVPKPQGDRRLGRQHGRGEWSIAASQERESSVNWRGTVSDLTGCTNGGCRGICAHDLSIDDAPALGGARSLRGVSVGRHKSKLKLSTYVCTQPHCAYIFADHSQFCFKIIECVPSIPTICGGLCSVRKLRVHGHLRQFIGSITTSGFAINKSSSSKI